VRVGCRRLPMPEKHRQVIGLCEGTRHTHAKPTTDAILTMCISQDETSSLPSTNCAGNVEYAPSSIICIQGR
jgi:hypothetical protein